MRGSGRDRSGHEQAALAGGDVETEDIGPIAVALIEGDDNAAGIAGAEAEDLDAGAGGVSGEGAEAGGIGELIAIAREGAIGPSRVITSVSSFPSTNSITKNGVPSSIPKSSTCAIPG